MIVTKDDLNGPGGAYLRVSDDAQEIATQRQTISEFEARNAVAIRCANRYEDIDWSRDETDRRPEWLRMLADIDAGKIKWLVISAKDRFGTASGRRKVLFYARLWDAGCKLILATTGEVLNAPSLASDLNALVDGDTEERELREKSVRALDKMRQHAQKGRWMGGTVPFGLDVVCTDITGREFWRVQIDGPDYRVKINPDGTRQTYEGKDNFPGRDRDQFLTLRPTTDAPRLGIIRDVFEWFDAEALSTYQIAARLNRRGDQHHRGDWAAYFIETMLKNMAYIGQPVWNRTSQAKWSEHVGGRTLPHAERNTRQREHARPDWIIPNQQFEPIVPIEQFERVQAKLMDGKGAPRAPKSSALWLSGLLFCTNCGSKMHGTMRAGVPSYICGKYLRKLEGQRRGCNYYVVTHADAEGWLREFFSETGQLWPAPATKAVIAFEETNGWTQALTRMAEATKAMLARIHDTAAKHRPKMIEPMDVKMRRYCPEANAGTTAADWIADSLASPTTLYKAIFNSERDRWTARLDQLMAEHREQVRAWSDLPTKRAKEAAAAIMAEVEAEIDQIELKLANASDTFEDARNQVSQLRADWLAAGLAIENDAGARQKAADVRKVVDRVNLTFAPTGLKRGKYHVEEVEIIPVGGSSAPDSNEVSAAQPTTPTIAATRACACGTCRSPSPKRPATTGFC